MPEPRTREVQAECVNKRLTSVGGVPSSERRPSATCSGRERRPSPQKRSGAGAVDKHLIAAHPAQRIPLSPCGSGPCRIVAVYGNPSSDVGEHGVGWRLADLKRAAGGSHLRELVDTARVVAAISRSSEGVPGGAPTGHRAQPPPLPIRLPLLRGGNLRQAWAGLESVTRVRCVAHDSGPTTASRAVHPSAPNLSRHSL
jgi:hypothetical protein